MKLEQSFEVQAPLEQVWQALIDVERVAPCLPGAAVTGRNDDGSYAGTFSVKVGPTSASYSGKLEMRDVDDTAHTATMYAQGSDKRGQGGASATIVSTLAELDANRTRVDVLTDYRITGRLARFGRGGMIEDISQKLLRKFADCLQASLAGGPSGADPAPSGGLSPAAGNGTEPDAEEATPVASGAAGSGPAASGGAALGAASPRRAASGARRGGARSGGRTAQRPVAGRRRGGGPAPGEPGAGCSPRPPCSCCWSAGAGAAADAEPVTASHDRGPRGTWSRFPFISEKSDSKSGFAPPCPEQTRPSGGPGANFGLKWTLVASIQRQTSTCGAFCTCGVHPAPNLAVAIASATQISGGTVADRVSGTATPSPLHRGSSSKTHPPSHGSCCARASPS